MARANQDDEGAVQAPLSKQVEEYCREVQTLVKQGIEHPRFEFKRSLSVSRDNLDDRLDFIKLLQGAANAEPGVERCIVVGGDPREKLFYPVSNAAEFDEATVWDIVSKYLDPAPRFHVFNGLQTDDRQAFVLLVLEANQPRPIVVKTEGKKTDGKVRLRVGDIWVKKGTGLHPASRADLDSMYRLRMEEEAEHRARQRFKHFSELSVVTQTFHAAAIRRPTRELLVGPPLELQTYAEDLIGGRDYQRLRMLLELSRESLVDGWDKLDVSGPGLPSKVDEYVSQVNDFFRNEFLPSIQSLVTVGLLVVKHDSESVWLQAVVDTLVEAFEASRGLQRLKSGYVIQQAGLPWWQPAFEIYLAWRCLATYAVSRERFRFLETLLPRFIARIAVDNRRTLRTPMLLWPLPESLFPGGELDEGRSGFYWKERISAFWGKYFGNFEKFLGYACQLEFLLELNSYLGTNSISDSGIKQWLEINGGQLSFTYNPDFFSYELQRTVPMAERCYDLIASDKPFPTHLAVEPALFGLALKGKNRDQRVAFFGGFLHHLKSWQAQVMWSFRRIPFMYSWEGRLLEAVQKYKSQLPRTA